MEPYLVYVYICLAGVSCSYDNNTMWENEGFGKFPNQATCIDYGKAHIPRINAKEGFKFEGQRLKLYVRCKQGEELFA
jgi:hypothetical protein